MIPTTNNSVNVFHEVTTGDKTTWEATASIANVPCYLEPMSPEMAMMYDVAKAFDTFKVFCDIVAIVRKDKLVDEQGNIYTVHGLQKFENNSDTDNHMEIVAYKSGL